MNIQEIQTLRATPLFRKLPDSEMTSLMENIPYRRTVFSRGDTIAIESEPCDTLGIVTAGHVEVQKIFASGKTLVMDKLQTGDIFGEVVIFSAARKYPATIIATSDVHIIFFSRDAIMSMCAANDIFLSSFMELLSNKILMLNRRIRNLSWQTLRQKIANMLLEEYASQNKVMLNLPYSRREMAERLGVPRPSVSREMAALKEDGLIDYEDNTVKLLNPGALEEILMS